MQNTLIVSSSLTVQDSAISSKFLKHTVSKITTLPKNHFSYQLSYMIKLPLFLLFGMLCFYHGKTVALFCKRSSSFVAVFKWHSNAENIICNGTLVKKSFHSRCGILTFHANNKIVQLYFRLSPNFWCWKLVELCWVCLFFSIVHTVLWYCYLDYISGITKKHWKLQSSSKTCMNRDCKKTFTFTEREHHCRKCGNIFCKTCLSYKRRLNNLAKPDPNGRFYKVNHAFTVIIWLSLLINYYRNNDRSLDIINK